MLARSVRYIFKGPQTMLFLIIPYCSMLKKQTLNAVIVKNLLRIFQRSVKDMYREKLNSQNQIFKRSCLHQYKSNAVEVSSGSFIQNMKTNDIFLSICGCKSYSNSVHLITQYPQKHET